MGLITKSALARRLDVAPSAVTKAVQTGRIADALRDHGGRQLLDEEHAIELWKKNTDHGRGGARPRSVAQSVVQSKSKPEAPLPPSAKRGAVDHRQLRAYIESLPEDEIPDLNESRARHEHYKAERAKLDALAGRKELVQIMDVKQEASRLARQVRDLLLVIPARNAARLAALQDPTEVRTLLEDEIEQALRGLANA